MEDKSSDDPLSIGRVKFDGETELVDKDDIPEVKTDIWNSIRMQLSGLISLIFLLSNEHQ